MPSDKEISFCLDIFQRKGGGGNFFFFSCLDSFQEGWEGGGPDSKHLEDYFVVGWLL